MKITLHPSPNNKSVIANAITIVEQKAEKITTDAFKLLGQAGLSYAIQNREWKDYTGNLQDSMGYGIFKNGFLIFWETLDNKQYNWGYGERIENHDPAPYGAQAALKVINSNYDIFSKGMRLLVVAGMSYALNVQNINLHEVITQAMSFTESNWKTYFKQVA